MSTVSVAPEQRSVWTISSSKPNVKIENAEWTIPNEEAGWLFVFILSVVFFVLTFLLKRKS